MSATQADVPLGSSVRACKWVEFGKAYTFTVDPVLSNRTTFVVSASKTPPVPSNGGRSRTAKDWLSTEVLKVVEGANVLKSSF